MPKALVGVVPALATWTGPRREDPECACNDVSACGRQHKAVFHGTDLHHERDVPLITSMGFEKLNTDPYTIFIIYVLDTDLKGKPEDVAEHSVRSVKCSIFVPKASAQRQHIKIVSHSVSKPLLLRNFFHLEDSIHSYLSGDCMFEPVADDAPTTGHPDDPLCVISGENAFFIIPFEAARHSKMEPTAIIPTGGLMDQYGSNTGPNSKWEDMPRPTDGAAQFFTSEPIRRGDRPEWDPLGLLPEGHE